MAARDSRKHSTAESRASFVLRASVLALCLAASACGGSVVRYNPGIPAVPTGLAATSGDGEVSLSWSAVAGASGYFIYYSTTTGVTKANGTRLPLTILAPTYLVTGLTNGTTYYFVVSSASASGESDVSSEVSSTPLPLMTPSQGDLTGEWRFSILSTGAQPGWKQGVLTVDAKGAVTFTSYLDSLGETTAPAGLFPNLLVNSSSVVSDSSDPASAIFSGFLDYSRRNAIVLRTASAGDTQSIALLMSHNPAVVFYPANDACPPVCGDIQGYATQDAPGGGSKKFSYSDLSSGTPPDQWGFAEGQIGHLTPPGVQFLGQNDVLLPYCTAGSPPIYCLNSAGENDPVVKVTVMAITTDGTVTESPSVLWVPGASTPAFLFQQGWLSDDKSVLIGIGTAVDGSARFVLRIYQFMNLSGDDDHTFTLSDLAGSYQFATLTTGANPLSASGTLVVDDTGIGTFTSYNDTTGVTVPPPMLSLVLDGNPINGFFGMLSDKNDPTLEGKISYFENLIVYTTTSASGVSSLTVALR